MVKEKIITLLPKFEMYLGNRYVGCISREVSLLKPQYNVAYNGWHMEGNVLEWNYRITGRRGERIAVVSKEVFRLTDTYVIDVANPDDVLCVLMLVLAVDAEKCTRGK